MPEIILPTPGDEHFPGQLLPTEIKLISDATKYLENPTLLMELANAVGKPLEKILAWIDRVAQRRVDRAVRAALGAALDMAVYTLPGQSGADDGVKLPDDLNKIGVSTDWWSKLSVGVTGAAGGLFGAAGLAVELPLTTTLIFRSIASTARQFGENLDDPSVRLQCLSVFALGGPSPQDEALECAYLTSRLGLQGILSEATAAVARASADELAAMIQKGTAPAIVNLIAKIAARFDVAVSQKLVAQTLPVIGAVSGAAINVAFIDHFNRVARFHFGIRSLERKYGLEPIQSLYRAQAIANKQAVRALPSPQTSDSPTAH